jgi:hypothetical protein
VGQGESWGLTVRRYCGVANRKDGLRRQGTAFAPQPDQGGRAGDSGLRRSFCDRVNSCPDQRRGCDDLQMLVQTERLEILVLISCCG